MHSGTQNYIPKIQTRNNFTDKPMALVAVGNLALFLTAYIIFAHENTFLSGKLDTLLNYKQNGMFLAFGALGAMLVYLFPLAVIGLFYLIPKIMIYANYILVSLFFIYSLYNSIMSGKILPIVLGVLSLGFMGFFLLRVISMIEVIKNMVRIACIILLRNPACYFATYLAAIVITVFLYLVLVFTLTWNDVLVWKNLDTDNIESLLKAVYILLNCTIYEMFTMYSIFVFYARATYQYMLNRVNSKENAKSILVESTKRVVLSTGTIFIAGLLSALISLARAAADNAFNSNYDGNRRSSGILHIFVLIGLFILSIVLWLLEITVKQLNNYCLVYNALYGTKYSTSMKSAVEYLRQTAFSSNSRLVCFSMLPIMLVSNWLVLSILQNSIPGLATKMSGDAGDMYSLFIICLKVMLSACALFLGPILQGSLTAIEFITYVDPALVKKSFPDQTEQIKSIGLVL